MTELTDRCAAVTAALQDLARDLEADLGKAARHRGTQSPSHTFPVAFRDPGPDLASFETQKAAHPASRDLPVSAILRAYHGAANHFRSMTSYRAPVGDHFQFAEEPLSPSDSAERAAQTAVVALAASIQNVKTYDDAVALVATFEGA